MTQVILDSQKLKSLWFSEMCDNTPWKGVEQFRILEATWRFGLLPVVVSDGLSRRDESKV